MQSYSEAKETPNATADLIEFLASICAEHLTHHYPDLKPDALNDLIKKQFAIMRLQTDERFTGPWFTFSMLCPTLSFDDLSKQPGFDFLAATLCNGLIKQCQHEIISAKETHWSVAFMKESYERRLIERFLEIEKKYESISWLSEQVQAEKVTLKALQSLPARVDAFLKTITTDGVEMKEADQGRKISLVEAILKQVSGPDAGLFTQIRNKFIKDILSDFNLNVSNESEVGKLYDDLVTLFYSPKTKPASIQDDFISSLMPPFSVQDFLYETITLPCSIISEKMTDAAGLVDQAVKLSTSTSMIDQVVHCGQFAANASHFFFNDPTHIKALKELGVPEIVVSCTSSVAGGITTLVTNAVTNEIMPAHAAFSAYMSSGEDLCLKDPLYLLLPEEGVAKTYYDEKYRKYFAPNANFLLDIYLFLKRSHQEDPIRAFSQLKKLMSFDITYEQFLNYSENIFKKIPENHLQSTLSDLIKVTQNQNSSSDETQFLNYFALNYKLYQLEKEFLKAPLTEKGIAQKWAILKQLETAPNDTNLGTYCRIQYKKLYFHFYRTHYKQIIEKLIDTEAHECKLGDKAIRFKRELPQFYTLLESEEVLSPQVQLLETAEKNAILSDLKPLYQGYKYLCIKFPSSQPLPAKIRQTPQQKIRVILDASVKQVMQLTTSAAITYLRSSNYSHLSESKPVSEYIEAIKAKNAYINSLIDILMAFDNFITTDPKAMQLLASILNNTFETPAISIGPNDMMSHVMSFIFKFAPSNAGNNTPIYTKLYEHFISLTPTPLQTLSTNYQRYQAHFQKIKRTNPELIFSLNDPLTTANSEELANSVTSQIYHYLNVGEHAQQTVFQIAGFIGSASPIGFVAREIFGSQSFRNLMQSACPDSVSTAASNLSETAKNLIYRQIGITVKERLARVIPSCFAENPPADSVDEVIFIDFLSKLYALGSQIDLNDDSNLETVITTIFLNESAADDKDFSKVLRTIKESFRTFNAAQMSGFPSFLIDANNPDQRINYTNRIQLLLLKKRIEIQFEALKTLDAVEKDAKLRLIKNTLDHLQRQMKEPPESTLYETIFSNCTAILLAAEEQTHTDNVNQLNKIIQREKEQAVSDIANLRQDRGPFWNWLNNFNAYNTLSWLKLFADATTALSAIRTTVICSITFTSVLAEIHGLAFAPAAITVAKYVFLGLSHASPIGLLTIGLMAANFTANAAYELFMARNDWTWKSFLVKGLALPLAKAAKNTALPYIPLYAVGKTLYSSVGVLKDTYKSIFWSTERFHGQEISTLSNYQASLNITLDPNDANLRFAITQLPISEAHQEFNEAKEAALQSISRLEALRAQQNIPMPPPAPRPIPKSSSGRVLQQLEDFEVKSAQKSEKPQLPIIILSEEHVIAAIKEKSRDRTTFEVAVNTAAVISEAAVQKPLTTTGLIAAVGGIVVGGFKLYKEFTRETPQEERGSTKQADPKQKTATQTNLSAKTAH